MLDFHLVGAFQTRPRLRRFARPTAPLARLMVIAAKGIARILKCAIHNSIVVTPELHARLTKIAVITTVIRRVTSAPAPAPDITDLMF
jgi:hypothetical protein